jgi:two-component system, NtrC family, response regulator AtoC
MQELIGESLAMQQLTRRIPPVARARRTTLISGPTGSGKEVVASRLHREALGTEAPYVAVHCGALPEQLIEAELFGHTRGAFTGAMQARPGLIRTATDGTLFLDEIDSLSLGVQSKLLRFLESGEFRAVGSDKVQHARVWILAATNQDLRQRVVDGAFREDLLYRLDVLHLHLPPLRQRDRDVELLARYFLERTTHGQKQLSALAVKALYGYEWPGNVRELKHRIERAACMCEGHLIGPEDLELAGARPCVSPAGARSPQSELWRMIERDGLSLAQALARCERLLIDAALEAEKENRTRAAQRLGIHVRTIFKKLQQ